MVEWLRTGAEILAGIIAFCLLVLFGFGFVYWLLSLYVF